MEIYEIDRKKLDLEEKTKLVCMSLFAKCNSRLLLVFPTKQHAGRCVDNARLDLSFDPQLHWEPTAVLNYKWTSNSSGSASEATGRLVNSGGL